jgi:hypothetical protein
MHVIHSQRAAQTSAGTRHQIIPLRFTVMPNDRVERPATTDVPRPDAAHHAPRSARTRCQAASLLILFAQFANSPIQCTGHGAFGLIKLSVIVVCVRHGWRDFPRSEALTLERGLKPID